MKLGIYVYSIPVGKSGGIQQYAEQLIYALGKYSNIETIVFSAPHNKETFEKYKTDNVSIVVLPKRYKYIRLLNNNRYIRRSPFLTKLISKLFSNKYFQKLMKCLGDCKFQIEKRVDLIHFPYQVLDRYDFNIPTIISLHDLQHKQLTEFFTEKQIKERDRYFKKSAQLASRIMVSFELIKKHIIKFYGISPEKIDICGSGADPREFIDTENFSEIEKKYKLPKNYLIYPAITWKHKNHIRLIQALKLLKEKYGIIAPLVCTGTKNEFFLQVESEIKRLGLEKDIIFTGFIPEQDFQTVLKKAKLVVIPTLYEGESIPLIEAMAVGVPVICSNATVLPEQIGDERFIFNPYNIDEMAEKIYRMLKDENLKEANIENGKKQISKIRWERKIKNFINCYQKALENDTKI